MNTPRVNLASAIILLLALAASSTRAAPLRLAILEAGKPTPARVHLADRAGKPVKPPGLPFWHDHFVCTGEVTLEVSPGEYRLVVERGPEYAAFSRQLSVPDNTPQEVRADLRRLVDLAAESWWSADLHVHRPLRDIELLMRAEDLHVAPVITWWNSRGPWASNPVPAELVVRFDTSRFYAPLAGEDERGGGALLFFGLRQPLPLEGLGREFPPSVKFLRDAKQQPGPWAEIEKPFWWDTPVWLATGLVDSVGIAHNHLHRSGTLDNEAWGRPRDRERFPGPQGNGRYTQELYYHVLNCGLRLPPSAGSASGVLPNPVGYNRVYAYIEPRAGAAGEALDWKDWWSAFRAGRVFVSNGPLLRCRANGQWPGHVFKSTGPLQVRLEGQLDSRDAIASLELVRDAHVEPVTLPGSFTIQQSGWFLVRAIADPTNTFRFASTGPWYVEIDGRLPPVRRASAQFFLDWTRERRGAVEAALTDATQREQALAALGDAEKFWQDKVAHSQPVSP